VAARRPVKIAPLGDAALLAELGQKVDTALNTRALALAAALGKRRDVREAVAGYGSVAVHYDPEQITYKGLSGVIQKLVQSRPPPAPHGRLHRIPVEYDGPDLEEVAAQVGMGRDEIVRLHTQPVYRCFMIGFVPGWAYLGPLPEQLRLPRRRVPRTHVPAGSVAMAGAQTGVYPLPTPGGWHLIGRTSVRLFLPNSDPPTLLRTGDRVKFFPA
jgi:KipI family sensor histidine kinase inhibitor